MPIVEFGAKDIGTFAKCARNYAAQFPCKATNMA